MYCRVRLDQPESNNFNESIEARFDKERVALIIKPDVLKRAKTNEARFELKVQHSESLAEKTQAGGDSRVFYQAAPVKVRILD